MRFYGKQSSSHCENIALILESFMGKMNMMKRIQAYGLSPPKTMTLMVTGGCNLYCRHCWLDCQPLENAAPIAASKITRVIDGFSQLGVTDINLTGGEILSHPEWHRILQFCLEHARIDSVCLQTNGIYITPKHLKTLLELQLDKLAIQVSLDGACAQTHDFVRGTGGHSHAMAGLGQLVNAGLGFRTQVAFTEMAHNFDELPELLKLVDKMGIGRLISSTLIKGGRAAASSQIHLPTPIQYRNLIHLYQTDTTFKMLYDQKATISAIEWFKNRSAFTDSGCCCLKNLFVDARGYVYPCTMLLLDRYASESVYSYPLDQIVEKALVKWREIPILNRKRQNELPSCSRCAGKNHCGGGCMGRAATSRGDLMDPEDRCELRKAVYNWATEILV
jgi:radical SAM protein with 4Fe4S-binding SPASM domain